MRSRLFIFVSGVALVVLALIASVWAFWLAPGAQKARGAFDPDRAYADLLQQVAFGPRVPGTPGHAAFVEWATEEFTRAGWDVRIHETTYDGLVVRNLIASRVGAGGGGPWTLLGAHYDSRALADRDPSASGQGEPVPGANDGASGVAVLLELARVLPEDLGRDVRIVLFDAEDGGNIDGAAWIIGSQALVRDLELLFPSGPPQEAVIIDMIGDSDLNIHIEMNSSPGLSADIWATAQEHGYGDVFLPLPKYSMLDDHTPFLRAGIPAVLIIDFDYAYWHTVEDTPDKTSPASLQAVGETLLAWLTSSAP